MTAKIYTIHDAINELWAQARRLAPAVAESAQDSGCTDIKPTTGARRIKAWEYTEAGLSLNAMSELPETVLPAGEMYSLEAWLEAVQRFGGTYDRVVATVIMIRNGVASDPDIEWVKVENVRPGDVLEFGVNRHRVSSKSVIGRSDGLVRVTLRFSGMAGPFAFAPDRMVRKVR